MITAVRILERRSFMQRVSCLIASLVSNPVIHAPLGHLLADQIIVELIHNTVRSTVP